MDKILVKSRRCVAYLGSCYRYVEVKMDVKML